MGATTTGPRLWLDRLRSDRLLQARALVAAGLLTHAVVLLVVARGWFFAGDDWEYLARGGLGDAMEPHGGHVTTFLAATVVAVRSVVGLDFWPAYPLVIAAVWPLVALAAWRLWRGSGVAPIPAAAGAVLIGWLAIGAYPLFGHLAMATVMAVFLFTLPIDDRPLTIGSGTANFGLSLLAVLADSSGVLVTAARAAAGLGSRRWTAVAGAVPALAVHSVVRSIVGSDVATPISAGLGDLGEVAGTMARLAGPGARQTLLLPAALEWVAIVVLVVVVARLLVRHRFGYRPVALVLAGVGYLAAVAVVRFLPSPERWQRFLDGTHEHAYMYLRFAVPLVLAAVVLAVPVVAEWTGGGRTLLRRWSAGALAAVLILGGVAGTLDVFGRISDRSAVAAGEAGAYAVLVDAGEPIVDPDRRAGKANNLMFTFEVLEYLSGRGLIGGLLASDIYRGQGAEITPDDLGAARGDLRFRFLKRAPITSWAEVGLAGWEGCREADGLELMVTAEASVRLESDGPLSGPSVRWEDGNGVGVRAIDPAVFGRSGRTTLRIAAPARGSPALVTLSGGGLLACLDP